MAGSCGHPGDAFRRKVLIAEHGRGLVLEELNAESTGPPKINHVYRAYFRRGRGKVRDHGDLFDQ